MTAIEFQARLALGDFRLDAEFTGEGPVTALFGPSGSGKSTILRIIAGLARPEAGRIALAGRTVFDSQAGIDLPPHKRRVGLVFQDGLLFPHLTVRQNLLYGSWARRLKRPAAFDATVALLGIRGLLDRAPRRLSGGERQRVAIGRAVLSDPAVLLMDEPVSAVDQERRAEILPYLEALTREYRVPLLYVSHSAAEIDRLTRDVVYVREGRVVESSPPPNLPHQGGGL